MNRRLFPALLLIAACAAPAPEPPAVADPLPSWNATATKAALLSFVERVTQQGGAEYVPPSERIAVFDNDGNLWAEQPLYFQAIYIFDRIRALAGEHPEWAEEEPYASVLRGDDEGALAGGTEALLQMAMTTHANISTDEFDRSVREWLSTARHPETNRPYDEMVYQPMLELLDYLRSNDFKTFIVSGGGIDFMRVFAEEVYGVPPEQIVGSSIKTGYEVRNGEPTLVKLPEMNFIDDKAGKPVGIHQHIGRRPILASGNSDGDFEMLEWTTAGDGARLGLIVHHDDEEREWTYDRESHIGQLDRGLDEAEGRGWVVISMRDDWNRIFP